MVFKVSLRMRECVRMPEVRIKLIAYLLADPGSETNAAPISMQVSFVVWSFFRILSFLDLT